VVLVLLAFTPFSFSLLDFSTEDHASSASITCHLQKIGTNKIKTTLAEIVPTPIDGIFETNQNNCRWL
jgi:hypothetical protein